MFPPTPTKLDRFSPMNFVQDFLHQKWEDLCALGLIVFGVVLTVWTKQGALGHDLVAAGLLGLKMKPTSSPASADQAIGRSADGQIGR